MTLPLLTLDGFARRVSDALEQRGTKLRDLEAEIGVTKSVISRASRGKSVSAENFVALWNWVHSTPMEPQHEP